MILTAEQCKKLRDDGPWDCGFEDDLLDTIDDLREQIAAREAELKRIYETNRQNAQLYREADDEVVRLKAQIAGARLEAAEHIRDTYSAKGYRVPDIVTEYISELRANS